MSIGSAVGGALGTAFGGPVGGAIGSAIGGSIGGKKKKKKQGFSDIQGQLAQDLFRQTDPLRQSLIGQSQSFLGGGRDVTQTPMYQNLQRTAGINFNQAKDNAIARFAPGGALIDALTQLESDRAGVLSQGASNIYGSELDRAMALGTGMTGSALGALGQAGNVQAMNAQANADRDAGKMSGIGSGIGAIIGSK